MSLAGETVHVAVRDSELAGTLVVPPARRPGALLVHGWGGNKEQYLRVAHEMAALGCICLTFDLTGHDAARSRRSEVTRGENLDDVTAAFDFLAAHPHVDENAIAVVGSSYGGYLAALLTERRHFPWLALRAPALYRDSEWELPKQELAQRQDLANYRRRVIAPADNRALRACSRFHGDALIVESERDTIVPRPTLTSYRRALQITHSTCYRVIAQATHALSDEESRDAYVRILIGWMKDRLIHGSALARHAPHGSIEEPALEPARAGAIAAPVCMEHAVAGAAGAPGRAGERPPVEEPADDRCSTPARAAVDAARARRRPARS
ncbi:alpha/beta hydrolase family protein [Dyella sp.]|jgi:dienelactone hydrolase|uniref:alpha/beta hydrolase family protein n=1 Tax=Dyella sp. TaxID=1869338 RepID=UPI002D78C730|nr:alpha/beta fold hydrolase [Dyella sp.]HET6433098.1 alpha/beta fold hydrolase [Dyella sp.]